MQLVFSHILAFVVLFVGAVYDIRTTEVPDSLNFIGVIGGILLHLWASVSLMDFGTLLSTAFIHSPFQWFMSLGDPLAWSLGVGIAFSIYGWGSYFLGLWGGADAFAMSVLGFAAPFFPGSKNLIYPLSVFVSVLLLGFLYTLLYGFYRLMENPEIMGQGIQKIKRDESRISLEILLVSLLSLFAARNNLLLGLTYFGVFVFLIIIVRIFQTIQSRVMQQQVEVKDLEPGEVVDVEDMGEVVDEVRSKNMLGRAIELVRSRFGGKHPILEQRLLSIERRLGYPEVVGITEEQIRRLDESPVEEVSVKSGLKFVPVFPAAILLVDLIGFRVDWLFIILS